LYLETREQEEELDLRLETRGRVQGGGESLMNLNKEELGRPEEEEEEELYLRLETRGRVQTNEAKSKRRGCRPVDLWRRRRGGGGGGGGEALFATRNTRNGGRGGEEEVAHPKYSVFSPLSLDSHQIRFPPIISNPLNNNNPRHARIGAVSPRAQRVALKHMIQPLQPIEHAVTGVGGGGLQMPYPWHLGVVGHHDDRAPAKLGAVEARRLDFVELERCRDLGERRALRRLTLVGDDEDLAHVPQPEARVCRLLRGRGPSQKPRLVVFVQRQIVHVSGVIRHRAVLPLARPQR